MSERAARHVPAVRVGDVAFSMILLVVFVGTYLLAQEWPFRARFVPELLSTLGVAFAVLKLLGFGVQARQHLAWKRQHDAASGSKAHAGGHDDDHGTQASEEVRPDDSIEYAFGTAGRRAWAAAGGWATGFFVSLWVFGVFVTVPVFALAYLRLAGRTTWRAAAIYAGVAGGVVWLAFRVLLYVPMPGGIF